MSRSVHQAAMADEAARRAVAKLPPRCEPFYGLASDLNPLTTSPARSRIEHGAGRYGLGPGGTSAGLAGRWTPSCRLHGAPHVDAAVGRQKD